MGHEGENRDLLEGGRVFLVEEPRPRESVSLFRHLHEQTGRSLVLSRTHPDRFTDLPHESARYWLTQSYGAPGAISPNNIPRLNILLSQFLERDERGTILIDGIEYLSTQNDFNSILRFFQLLVDKVTLSRSSIIITIDPLAFPSAQLHLLRRETVPLDTASVRQLTASIAAGITTFPAEGAFLHGDGF